MKKYIFIIAIGFMSNSCNSQDKENNKSISTEKSFDISQVNLNENINDILQANKLSEKDTINNSEFTYLGNEKMAFNSDKLLIFNNKKFQTSDKKNLLLIHYGKVDKEIGALHNEKDNIVGMYQLNIYDKENENKLKEELLKKIGKPFFNTTKAGNKAEIVDNNLVPTKDKYEQEINIWKKSGLIYYLFKNQEEGKSNENKEQLFIFKEANKEWLDFLNSQSYPQINEITK